MFSSELRWHCGISKLWYSITPTSNLQQKILHFSLFQREKTTFVSDWAHSLFPLLSFFSLFLLARSYSPDVGSGYPICTGFFSLFSRHEPAQEQVEMKFTLARFHSKRRATTTIVQMVECHNSSSRSATPGSRCYRKPIDGLLFLFFFYSGKTLAKSCYISNVKLAENFKRWTLTHLSWDIYDLS